MTYKICKKMIETKDFNNIEKDELKIKLNVFLLNNSISQEEYEELIGLLNDKMLIDNE